MHIHTLKIANVNFPKSCTGSFHVMVPNFLGYTGFKSAETPAETQIA